jgi:hypothetical protein
VDVLSDFPATFVANLCGSILLLKTIPIESLFLW